MERMMGRRVVWHTEACASSFFGFHPYNFVNHRIDVYRVKNHRGGRCCLGEPKNVSNNRVPIV